METKSQKKMDCKKVQVNKPDSRTLKRRYTTDTDRNKSLQAIQDDDLPMSQNFEYSEDSVTTTWKSSLLVNPENDLKLSKVFTRAISKAPKVKTYASAVMAKCQLLTTITTEREATSEKIAENKGHLAYKAIITIQNSLTQVTQLRVSCNIEPWEKFSAQMTTLKYSVEETNFLGLVLTSKDGTTITELVANHYVRRIGLAKKQQSKAGK